MRSKNKIFLVIIFPVVLFGLSFCRTAPTIITDSSGQFDAGNGALGTGQGYIDSASGKGKNLAGDIGAAGKLEADRAAKVAGAVGGLGSGFTEINRILGQCEEFVRESQDELQRYIDSTKNYDGGPGQIPK